MSLYVFLFIVGCIATALMIASVVKANVRENAIMERNRRGHK